MNAAVEQPVLPFARGDWRIEPRGSVGHALADARRRRALSIEDIAAQTRVPIRYLAAIEAERFDEIPGAIYIKGFVKAFARAVGLCERWALGAGRGQRAAGGRTHARPRLIVTPGLR